MLLLDSREIVRFKVLFGQLNLRHQLVGDDLQHFFQFSQVIGAEALFSALHDQVQVGIADVVVINVLLGWAQAVFAFVGSRPDALDLAFFNQRVDLIGSVGGGKVHHVAELRDRRFAQCHDNFHAERFYSRQRSFAVLESAEDLLIEMQLEFGIYLSECLVQHGENPPVG